MTLLSALRDLLSKTFSEDTGVFPQPYLEFLSTVAETSPFDLPSVLVPPEVIEIDSMDIGGTMFEDNKTANKREELPQFYLALFDNEVNLHFLLHVDPISKYVLKTCSQITPDPTTPAGYSLRSTLNDVIDIFEVNRKECARLLLDMPKWIAPGTFKPKPGTVAQTDAEQALKPGMGWQLESTIIEVSQSDGRHLKQQLSSTGVERQSCLLC
jgi:nuclear cap-binding protein subunit 1